MRLSEQFRGLADPSRLRMLNLLLAGELCGCDIQHVLGLSQSNVSRHLTYLRRAGLVVDRRDGNRVFYRLADDRGRRQAGLFEYLRRAFASEPVFGADRRALKRAIRHGACTVSERRVITDGSGGTAAREPAP